MILDVLPLDITLWAHAGESEDQLREILEEVRNSQKKGRGFRMMTRVQKKKKKREKNMRKRHMSSR